jgi:hypothetical protein
VIVQIKVRSGTKNPYFIYLPKTDRSGSATITRDDFVGQFEDHFESGLMDYNGTVEDANPMVEARLYDPTWALRNEHLAMAWPLLTHERTKWKSRREAYEYLTSCRNLHFDVTPVEMNIERRPTIDLVATSLDDGAA